MICPLRLANDATPMNQAECLRDRCTWWDSRENICAILVLAGALGSIAEGVKK